MINQHINLLDRAKPQWLYPIYVPSYNRAGTAPLLNMLAEAGKRVQDLVTIVVRPEEKKSYTWAYPWARVISERAPGIGPARMRALVDADVLGYRNIVVLDDDIIHISLLEETYKDNGDRYAKRFSSKLSGMPEPALLIYSLAVGCKLASALFRMRKDASYGAARNALFAGPVADPSIGAMLNKQSFPACVMFFNVARFKMRWMPEPYQYHGEDLAMFLDNLSRGKRAFQFPWLAYDQHGNIKSTIPLDPQSEEGRPHLNDTERLYPAIHPYLRVSVRNKLGGVMRIGLNWARWYKDTKTGPDIIPMTELLKEIK